MITAPNIVAACWLAWLLYWLITWRSVKPAQQVHRGTSGFSWYIVAGLILFVFLEKAGLPVYRPLLPPSNLLIAAGLVVTVAGLATTIWARATLGRNWSAGVELKVNPELVTTGIYRYVRHPIYSGILLMTVGTLLVMRSPEVMLLFLVVNGWMVFKLRQEERLLTQNFPSAYPAYKERTRALIPFVL